MYLLYSLNMFEIIFILQLSKPFFIPPPVPVKTAEDLRGGGGGGGGVGDLWMVIALLPDSGQLFFCGGSFHKNSGKVVEKIFYKNIHRVKQKQNDNS